MRSQRTIAGVGGALSALIAALLIGVPAGAQTDGYFEIIANRRDVETEFPDGERTDSRIDGLIGRVNVEFRRSVFPNLSYRLGGLFDRDVNKTVEDAGETTFIRDRLRPFLAINLATPSFVSGLFVERLDERFEFDESPTTVTTQETYRFTMGWVPEDVLPQLRLETARRNRFDRDRQSQDIREDTLAFLSRYRPRDSLDANYRGTFRVLQNRLNGTETETTSHLLRVRYGDGFWDSRVLLDTEYLLNYSETKTIVPGQDEFFVPNFPFRGLAVLDETPEFGPLPENPLLIDGDTQSPTGVDIGLPPPGADDRPRNIGIDFAAPVEVNTVRVWVDQELPPEIVAAFTWTVYTSEDNLEWTFRGILPAAPFDRFEDRFEIRFDAVTTRFVKVVTSPLTPGVPNATDFPSIAATEIQAGITRRADDRETSSDSLSQIFNLGSRARPFLQVPIFYDFSLFLTKQESAPARYNMLNGLSYNERFARIYTVSTRIAREDNQEPTQNTFAYLYSASFSAAPLDTFRASATLSSRDEEGDVEGLRDSRSLFLTSTATLYTGIDLSLTAGATETKVQQQGRTTSREGGGSLTLIPHRALAINLSYRARTVDSPSDTVSPLSDPSRATAFGSIGFRPLRALYFFAARRVDDPGDEEERRQDDYAFSWTPFQDGTVRILVSYGETRRTFPDSKEGILLTTFRWNIRPRAFLELSYRNTLRDSIDLNVARSNIYSARLRAGF